MHAKGSTQTSYAGAREPRPLRRRSISSPRTPYAAFASSPSLVYRSPLLRFSTPSPPIPDELYPSTEVLFPRLDRSTVSPAYIDYDLHKKRVMPFSIRSTWLRMETGRWTQMIIVFLGLWGFLWLIVDHYTIRNGRNFEGSPPSRGRPAVTGTQLLANSPATFQHRTQQSNSGTLPSSVAFGRYWASMFPKETNVAGDGTLTIVLPCPAQNLTTSLPATLYALSNRYNSIRRQFTTLIVCMPNQAREALVLVEHLGYQDIFVRVASEDNPTQLAGRNPVESIDQALVHVAAHANTDWVMILDTYGLSNVPLSVVTLLYHPPNFLDLPFGPRGVLLSTPSVPTCISSTNTDRIGSSPPIPAAYLVPPFTVPTRLLHEAESSMDLRSGLGVWAHLGQRMFTMPITDPRTGLIQETGHLGAVVVGADVGLKSGESGWCTRALAQVTSNGSSNPPTFEGQSRTPNSQMSRPIGGNGPNLTPYLYSSFKNSQNPLTSGTIIVLLLDIPDLLAFAPTLCRMSRIGHVTRVLVYGRHTSHPDRFLNEGVDVPAGCHIHFDTLAPQSRDSGQERHGSLDGWLSDHGRASDVVIAMATDLLTKLAIDLAIVAGVRGPPGRDEPVTIWIPRSDLGYMEWTGMLTIGEWRSESTRSRVGPLRRFDSCA